jgi:bifunctional non-homologous end joining protein LigD
VDGVLFSKTIEAKGELAFAKACAMGLEGLVWKRRGSLYRSGTSRQWRKCKTPAFVRS